MFLRWLWSDPDGDRFVWVMASLIYPVTFLIVHCISSALRRNDS